MCLFIPQHELIRRYFIVLLGIIFGGGNIYAGNLNSDYMNYVRSITSSNDRGEVIKSMLYLAGANESTIETNLPFLLGKDNLNTNTTTESNQSIAIPEPLINEETGSLLSDAINCRLEVMSSSDIGVNTLGLFVQRHPDLLLGNHPKLMMFVGNIDSFSDAPLPIRQASPGSTFPEIYAKYCASDLDTKSMDELKALVQGFTTDVDSMKSEPWISYLIECYLDKSIDLQILSNLKNFENDVATSYVLKILMFAENQEIIDWGLNYLKEVKIASSDSYHYNYTGPMMGFLVVHKDNPYVQQEIANLLTHNPWNFYGYRAKLAELLSIATPKGIEQSYWDDLISKIIEHNSEVLKVIESPINSKGQ